MATPANRAKIQLVRGTYTNISASIGDLLDGELCYAKDQNRLYMVEGSTLTEIQADPEDIEGLIASIIVGGTGITSTHDNGNDTVTLSITDVLTSEQAGTYGSSSSIPTFTVNQQGQITAASSNDIILDAVLIDVHNQTGADLSKGDVVNVTGTHASGKPTVGLADSTTSNGDFPAIGLVYGDIANGTDGKVIISGSITNLNTSSYSAGDALYLTTTAGDLTATRPTASDQKVQKVGLVQRSHASAGSILVIGAGRVNDVNNELTALTGVALNAVNLGQFTGSTIADDQSIKQALQALETKAENIVNADISATAEIAVSKLADGAARQLLQTAANGSDVEWASNIDIPGTLDVTNAATFDSNVTIAGDLTIRGTTTTVSSITVTAKDRNIELGTVAAGSFTGDITAGSADIANVSDLTNLTPGVVVTITSGGGTVTLPASTRVQSISGTTVTLTASFTGTGNADGATLAAGGPSDVSADGGGITLKGTSDKTFSWVDSTNSWTSSEDIDLASTKDYKMNNTTVLGYDGSNNRILDNVIVDGGTY